jgi:hypothetical protein
VSPGRVMVRDHGEPLAEEGPRLRVEVRIHREGDEVLPVGPDSRRGLAEGLWWEAAPTAYHPAEHWDQVGAGRRRPDPVWSQLMIPVDGQPVGFGWLAEGRHWVALAELEDRMLILRGRDLPVESVELVRVLDLEPYIGQRAGRQPTLTGVEAEPILGACQQHIACSRSTPGSRPRSVRHVGLPRSSAASWQALGAVSRSCMSCGSAARATPAGQG